MKLSEILSQFKYVKADPHYVERSRREILAQPQIALSVSGRRPMMVFFRALETAGGLVIAGLLVMFATGGFFGTTKAPIDYAVLDPNGLHAEAQAIDIQIQLANVHYSEVAPSIAMTTPSMAGSAAGARPSSMNGVRTTTASSGVNSNTSSTPSSTPSSTLSLNQALQALSQ